MSRGNGPPSKAHTAYADAGLRPVVTAVLRYGVLCAGGVLVIGLVMLAVQVGPRAFVSMPRLSTDEGSNLTSLRAVLRELVPPVPEAVLDTGVLLLIATPALTVGASAVAFGFEGDWLYVAIAGVVFALLVISFALGRGVSAGPA